MQRWLGLLTGVLSLGSQTKISSRPERHNEDTDFGEPEMHVIPSAVVPGLGKPSEPELEGGGDPGGVGVKVDQ